MAKKISDLPQLPGGQNLSGVLLGTDNTNNQVSYYVSVTDLFAQGDTADNLGWTANATTGSVTNDNGSGTVIGNANSSQVGLLTPANFDKLGLITVAVPANLDTMQTQIGNNETNISANSALITANENAINSLQTSVSVLEAEVSDIRTLTGTNPGATDLGTFLGTTIRNNADIKEALQDLENGIEGAVVPTVLSDLNDVNTSGVVLNNILQWNGSQWVPAVMSSGNTDLGWIAATRTVTSSTGQDAVITVATTGLPGLMSAADKIALDGAIQDGTKLSGVAATERAHIFKQEVGTNLEFRELTSADASVTITESSGGVDLSAADVISDLNDVNTAGAANGNVLTYNGAVWVPTAPSSGVTDLGWVAATQTMTSSSGQDAVINLATATLAGLMSPGDKTRVQDTVMDGTQLTGAASTQRGHIFKQKLGDNLEFRELTSADDSVIISESSGGIDLQFSGIGGGQINSGLPLGSTGDRVEIVDPTNQGALIPIRSLISSNDSVNIALVNGDTEIDLTVVAAGGTDITVSESPTTVTILSSTGGGDGIDPANSVNAGIMLPAQFDKLENITVTIPANLDTMQSDIAGNTAESANIRLTQGTSFGDTHLGTFIGGSIISDNASVKTALAELEVYAEAHNIADGTNLGTGEGQVFAQPNDKNLEFRTLRAGSGITINQTPLELEIVAAAAAGTDITVNHGALDATILSSTGTGDNIEAATAGQAGLLLPADFNKLQWISVTQPVNLDTMEGDIATNSAEVTNIRLTQGVAGGSTHLGTFSGTVIPDNTDIKNALQSLELHQELVLVDDGSNRPGVGTGEVYSGKVGTELQFRKINAGSGISILQDANDITLNVTGGSDGEINEATNLGLGVQVAVEQNNQGSLIPFRTLTSPDASIAIAQSGDGNEVELQVSAAFEDTSITAGNLATAANSRTVDMGGNVLDFDDVALLRFHAGLHILRSQDGNSDYLTVGGGDVQFGDGFRAAWFNSTGANNIGFRAPETLTTHTLTLPGTLPNDGDVMAVVAGGGGSSPTLGYVAQVDTNFANTDLERPPGTGTVTHEFNDNVLTIQSTANMTFSGAQMSMTGTSFLTLGATLGAFIQAPSTSFINEDADTGALVRLNESQNAAGSEAVGFKAADNMTSSYDMVLPAARPTATGLAPVVIAGENTQEPVLDWQPVGGGGGGESRKGDADDEGTQTGAYTINFDSGDFDNKILAVSGNIDITLDAPTRSGRYALYIRSTDGTRRNLTWILNGGQWSKVAEGNIPAWVESDEVMKIELEYDTVIGRWMVDPVGEEEVVVVGNSITPGSWQPDHGRGPGRYQRVTGQLQAGVVIEIPLNMPINETMFIAFDEAQSSAPTISSNTNLVKMSDEPDWNRPNVVIAIHRTGASRSYYFTFANER